MRIRLALAALLAAAACFPLRRPVVSVARSGVRAPPKPAGCALTFLKVAPEDQPYDELARISYTTKAHWPGDPADAREAIRAEACALGADAVLVSRDFAPGIRGDETRGEGRAPTMTGVAVRWRAPRPAVLEDRAGPQAPLPADR
jgi:hypothetical protein